MSTIDGIRGTATTTGTRVRSRAASTGETAPVPAARSLMVVEPAARAVPPSITSNRTSAGFLAHLIAIDQQAPQTRTRRRTEPAQATVAYRAALDLVDRTRPPVLSKAC